MNKYIKYAAIGLAGYFIGFYEMKYKFIKALVAIQNNNETESSDEEDESQ